jgi:hypothetical protein
MWPIFCKALMRHSEFESKAKRRFLVDFRFFNASFGPLRIFQTFAWAGHFLNLSIRIYIDNFSFGSRLVNASRFPQYQFGWGGMRKPFVRIAFS